MSRSNRRADYRARALKGWDTRRQKEIQEAAARAAEEAARQAAAARRSDAAKRGAETRRKNAEAEALRRSRAAQKGAETRRKNAAAKKLAKPPRKPTRKKSKKSKAKKPRLPRVAFRRYGDFFDIGRYERSHLSPDGELRIRAQFMPSNLSAGEYNLGEAKSAGAEAYGVGVDDSPPWWTGLLFEFVFSARIDEDGRHAFIEIRDTETEGTEDDLE